jgi:hypothetical protein
MLLAFSMVQANSSWNEKNIGRTEGVSETSVNFVDTHLYWADQHHFSIEKKYTKNQIRRGEKKLNAVFKLPFCNHLCITIL